ncbi:hypothetical protein [Candidatus Avelusimicrobium fimicolum]|uniref:hypothetical protein n=1 Tax=Candidatus Avelusimicrobium fimicolum TaxID=3416216 RepID=UPI003D0A0D0D
MSKRFTDTDKWTKRWFGDLSLREKLLWLYCCDACDAAGVADFSPKFYSMVVGFPVKKETLDKAFGKRIVWVEESKFFIPSFVEFQYGCLAETCKPHKPIIKELEKLELLEMKDGKGIITLSKLFTKGIDTLEEKEKEQEKEIKGGLGEKDPFAAFWAVYPKQRVGNKDKARAAFLRAVKRSGLTAEQITAKAAEYAQGEEVARGYAKGAEAWLNDDRFLRSYGPAQNTSKTLEEARREGQAKIDEIFGGSK